MSNEHNIEATEPQEPAVTEASTSEVATAVPVMDNTPVDDAPKAPTGAQIIIDEEYTTTPTQFDPEAITVQLPSDTRDNTIKTIENLPNINLNDNPESRLWTQVVRSGLEYTPFGDAYKTVFQNPNAIFGQGLNYNGQRYQGQAPKIKSAENENLKGERAVLRVIRQLGLGTTFQTPLWHSGLWVTLKPPTDAEIIELNRLIIGEKIRLGRYTYGLIYGNTTVYTLDALMDFITAHIYTTTVKNEELPIQDLRKHMSVLDLFTLVAGFACTMYPKGFQYQRACMTNPEKCQHVVEDRLNLDKNFYVDNAALSEWQKAHMSGRQPFSRDLASMKRYQDELLGLKNRRIKISTDDMAVDLWITLKSPTVAEYVDEGHKWISGLVDRINTGLTTTDDDAERNLIVTRFAQAATMRQYAHWVQSIELDTNVIDDRETIDQTLDALSAEDRIAERFIAEVVKYINDATLSVVGIASFDCPKCKNEQSGPVINPSFKNVIPLDVVHLFFGLITQRIQRIARR